MTTNEQALTVPTLSVVGTTYEVEWKEGVTVKLDQVYQHTDKTVKAEVTIEDRNELNPHLYGPTLTTINGPWRGVISELRDVSDRPDWRQRLTQVTYQVLKKFREGAPIIALGGIEPPEPIAEVLPGLVWQGLPSLIYAPGGVGKSTIGLAMASALHNGGKIAGIQAIQSNVLFLDWETSDRMTWHRNNGILRAQGLEIGDWPDPNFPGSGRTRGVWYRFMAGPIWDSAEFLKAEIARRGITTVVIDSAAPACGGEPESAAPTLKFFDTLRTISDPDNPVQSIILAHVTHEARKSGKGGSPFGSIMWLNQPRNIFYLDGDQMTGGRADYALHHKKSNTGSLQTDPIGMRLIWEQDGCRIEGMDVNENSRLRAGLGIAERATFVIAEDGPQPLQELTEKLGEKNPASVSVILSRNSDQFKSVDGKWALVKEPLGKG